MRYLWHDRGVPANPPSGPFEYRTGHDAYGNDHDEWYREGPNREYEGGRAVAPQTDPAPGAERVDWFGAARTAPSPQPPDTGTDGEWRTGRSPGEQQPPTGDPFADLRGPVSPQRGEGAGPPVTGGYADQVEFSSGSWFDGPPPLSEPGRPAPRPADEPAEGYGRARDHVRSGDPRRPAPWPGEPPTSSYAPVSPPPAAQSWFDRSDPSDPSTGPVDPAARDRSGPRDGSGRPGHRPRETWPEEPQDAAADAPAGMMWPTGEEHPPTAGDAPARPMPPVPARLSSLVAGIAAAVLFAAPVVGTRDRLVLGLAGCLLVQVVFVLSWVVGTRRPGPWPVLVVGLACGAVADLLTAFGPAVSLAALGYVVAGGLAAGVLGQLARGKRRDRVTESLCATMVAVVGAVSVPTVLVLARHGNGVAVVTALLAACGGAVLLARLTDVVWLRPRTSSQVSRGIPGLLMGGVVGAAVLGYLVGSMGGLPGLRSALAGLVVGLAAVFADIGVSFGTASGPASEEAPPRWPGRLLLGPATAVTVAAPACYVLGVLVLLPSG